MMEYLSFQMFKDSWLNEKEYPEFSGDWLVKKNDVTASCKLCRKDISISNMGFKALLSHMKSSKHQLIMKEKRSSSTISTFFHSSNGSSSTHTDTEKQTKSPSNFLIEQQSTSDDVTSAEIIWCLKVACSHYSFRSCSDLSEIFPLMFKNNDVANLFSMSYDKVAYYLNFGLYPILHSSLVREVRSLPIYSVSFDESLNKAIQEQQMDVYVRFWSEEKQMAVTRYFNTVCLGYTTATEMIDKFKDCIEELSIARIQQISMDGPNVNWKFYDILKGEIDPDDPKFIETGSCGIHILNCAFKKGSKATTWNIEGLLRCLYLYFHDAPARRKDFQKVNGCGVLFPLKYCNHRWLENRTAAERAIYLWPSIVGYIDAVHNDSALKRHSMNSHAFDVILSMSKDPLILAKLHFYLFVCTPFHQFLQRFQSEFPLLPFMYESVYELLQGLMKKVVKPEVLQSVSENRLCHIDLQDKKNLLLKKDTEIGTGARCEVIKATERSQLDSQQRILFFGRCQQFIVQAVTKLQSKNPLNYKFVRNCSSLSPTLIDRDQDACYRRYKNLVLQVCEANRITASNADLAIQQFEKFITELIPSKRDTWKEFSSTQRLDTFYWKMLEEEPSETYDQLRIILKIVFCLFHGNADVERGFSVNKEVLQPNMLQRSLRSLRTIHDVVKSSGGISGVNISKEMITAARAARSRYRQHLDSKRIANEDSSKTFLKRKASSSECQEIKEKKSRLNSQIKTLEKDADKLSFLAESKSCFTTLAKANAIRACVQKKKEELSVLEQKFKSH